MTIEDESDPGRKRRRAPGAGDAPAVEIDDALAVALRRLESAICTDEQAEAADAERGRTSSRMSLVESGIWEALSEEDRDAVTAGELREEEGLVHVRKFLTQTTWPGGFPYLCMMGGTGTGKTLAAAWGLTQVPGRYIESEDLCQVHAQRPRDAAARETWRRVTRCGLLVVDELGTEENLERAIVMYRDLLSGRPERRRPTIMLGNLDAKAFWSRFDIRTRDRLNMRGYTKGLKGESLRRRVEPTPPRGA